MIASEFRCTGEQGNYRIIGSFRADSDNVRFTCLRKRPSKKHAVGRRYTDVEFRREALIE